MSSVASELVMFDAQLKEEKDYWLKKLTGKVNGSILASDYDGPRRAAGELDSVEICISERLYERIVRLTNGSPFLTYTALMSALKVCLHRHSGNEVVIVGSPALKELGRPNALSILDVVDDQASFRQLLTTVRATLLEAYRSQRYPYDYLLRDLGLDAFENKCPFFEVGLATLELHGSFPDLKNDLTIVFAAGLGKLTGCLEFNKLRWRRESIQRFGVHFLNLLRAGLESIDSPLFTLEMLPASERHQVVVEWNDTSEYLPETGGCFLSLFSAQVTTEPDAISLVYEDDHLTYDELNRRANQLSNYLRRLGVGPEICAGLFMERSPDIVIGLLSILKAGGAYVPVDPGYPRERIAFVMQDTQMHVVLSQRRLLELLPDQSPTVICPDSCWEAISLECAEDSAPTLDPNNLAYVLYTSGSTGTPKGVMIPHAGLGNYLRWSMQAYSMRQGRGAPVHSPIAFDLTITALLAPLAAGSTSFLIPEEDPLTGLASTMWRTGGMSLVKVTPSHLDALTRLLGQDEFYGWTRALVVGGEALFAETLRLWQVGDPDTRVINEYGPTEAVVGCCVYEAPFDSDLKGAVPIGRPIANATIYLLDGESRPAAIGVMAELYIGGTGLARGYLNRPATTAGSFIPNPLSDEPGLRIYSTGDMARQGSNGILHFLGRRDHQVKIRGYRIELTEVEAILSEHPRVLEAVAVVQEHQDQRKRLVAYLVSDRSESPGVEELREYLKQRLPDYAIPAAFVLLDKLPLTSNGKVDRAALREPEHAGADLKTAFLPPRNAAELTLANVWAQVLGIERIGINDNFFELGGDSILSIQIVARANQAGLRLNPRQLFRYQTIAELAQVAKTAGPRIEQGLVTGSAPLTPIQRWFFELGLPDPHHFNQAVLLEVRGRLDLGVVETAVGSIFRWHDALRLRFSRDDRSWKQTEAGLDEADPFLALDLSALSESDQSAAIAAAAAQLQTSLDLIAGPLLRVALFETGANSPSRLLFIVHHLVVDGVSWRILLEDFQSACRQLAQGHPIEFPAKTTSYQRWARCLEEYAKSPALQPETDYWLSEGRRSVHALPVDYVDGINSVESARIVTVTLSGEETRHLLQQVPQSYRTQINEVLLTALAEAVAHWTGSTSIRIDLEGHGREELFDDLDLTRTVGWFTASFPVLLEVNGDSDTPANLRAVKEQLRAVPGRGIGYGLLRYQALDQEIREQLRALPAAQVSFNYFGQFDQALPETSSLAPARESTGSTRSQLGVRSYLLEISGSVAGGQLRMNWMFSENVHRRSTIQALGDGFVESLRSIIARRGLMGTGSYIASDFALAGLGERELDNVRSTLRHDGRIDDIYPLSPLQEGLLFHSLYAPHSGVYIAQMVFTLTRLNFPAFRQAWQRLVERHGVFRTAFVWKDIEKPVQVVVGPIDVNVTLEDWRELSPEEQQHQLDSYLEEDSRRGFDLSIPPLMRLALFQTNDLAYHFVWTHHHLLLDGWSMSLVAKELFGLYDSFSRAKGVEPEIARPYRDYVAFLQDRDLGAAEAYWRGELKGFAVPSALDGDLSTNGTTKRLHGHAEHRLKLSTVATAALQAWGRNHRLTINTLLQAAWALVLGNCLGRKEVLFGTVVSGRPASLTGIESMVGLFINTLPVRARLSPEAMLIAWLEEIQQQQAEMQQYDYAPLVRIHDWSDVPKGSPLFDSILVVENYPVEQAIAAEPEGLGVRLAGLFERLNYPVTIVVGPGQELSIKIVYDSVRFSESMIDRIGRHLQSTLGGFIDQDQTRLSALQEMLQRSEAEELDERRALLAKTLRIVKRKPMKQSTTHPT